MPTSGSLFVHVHGLSFLHLLVSLPLWLCCLLLLSFTSRTWDSTSPDLSDLTVRAGVSRRWDRHSINERVRSDKLSESAQLSSRSKAASFRPLRNGYIFAPRPPGQKLIRWSSDVHRRRRGAAASAQETWPQISLLLV